MNETFIKADIFFAITTVAVIVLGIGLGIAIVYAIRILRNVDELSLKAKEEGERILEDIKFMREKTEEKSSFAGKIISSAIGLGLSKLTSKKSRHKKGE